MGQFRRKTLITAFVLTTLFLALSIDVYAESTPAITIELGQRFGEFIVINHGSALLIQSAVVVEQELGGKWQKIPISNLELREVCLTSPSPSCIELGANATLRPVPWTGNFCSSQCPVPCRLDNATPPGTYRFVIAPCYGKRVYTSPPFEKAK